MKRSTTYVFGLIPEEDNHYAFVRELDAHSAIGAWAAVGRAKTWREFWEMLPESYWDQLEYPACVETDEDGEPPQYPNDDTPFDVTLLSSYPESFPSLAHIGGDGWIPEDLQRKYAKRVGSILAGEWNVYPASIVEELVAELRQRGFNLRIDHELIKYSCSWHVRYWPPN